MAFFCDLLYLLSTVESGGVPTVNVFWTESLSCEQVARADHEFRNFYWSGVCGVWVKRKFGLKMACTVNEMRTCLQYWVERAKNVLHVGRWPEFRLSCARVAGIGLVFRKWKPSFSIRLIPTVAGWNFSLASMPDWLTVMPFQAWAGPTGVQIGMYVCLVSLQVFGQLDSWTNLPTGVISKSVTHFTRHSAYRVPAPTRTVYWKILPYREDGWWSEAVGGRRTGKRKRGV